MRFLFRRPNVSAQPRAPLIDRMTRARRLQRMLDGAWFNSTEGSNPMGLAVAHI